VRSAARTNTATFCVLPWVHAATLTDGSVRLCCVAGGESGINLNEQTIADYWNSEYVKDARRRMLAGEPVKACERCYLEERHGYKSHRLVENEVWRQRCGGNAIEELAGRTREDGALDASLQYIDLRLGNTCNMQCIMCQPRESSRWVAAARTLSALSQDPQLRDEWSFRAQIDGSRFEWYRNGTFWENLKSFLPSVKEMIIAGGEPFLIRQQFDFVQACCEMGEANHIRLRYHTNGTIFPEQMVPYWKQFEAVHFFISLDGVGEVANYIRYPTGWEQMQANIRRFDAVGENTLTNFHFTTHALNVYHIPDVLAWANESRLENRKRFTDFQEYVCLSLVHDPAYQNIRVLPAPYKKIVTRRIQSYIHSRLSAQRTDKLSAILQFMNAGDDSAKLPTLIEYTRLLDQTRGTEFSATFPELVPFWKQSPEPPPGTRKWSRAV